MNRDAKFGIFLKEQRKNRGLSQYQLGKLLGVSDRAVSKWENGLSKPNSKLLLRISEILCMSIDELLEAELRQNKVAQSGIKVDELSDGKLVVFVTHRLSTVHMADYIYVIDEGRICECGTHDNLMMNNGIYSKMYEAQAKHYT